MQESIVRSGAKSIQGLDLLGLRAPVQYIGNLLLDGVTTVSPLETAKLCDLEPRDYLAQATRHAIANPGSVLLPHDLVKSPRQESAA